MVTYEVQLPVYQGPLDLLLELIERAELDITKIALAQVTDQYLAHLRALDHREPEEISAFLVIAARLLQIKSEALLPRPPVREPGEEDPGEALARQLRLYRHFKRVAQELARRQAEGLRSYPRQAPPPALEPRLDLTGLSASDLQRLYLALLQAAPSTPPLEEVVAPPPVRLRDQVRLILHALRRAGRTTFGALLRRFRSRVEIVVSFLAVLELVKQRRVVARQEGRFGDIELLPGPEWTQDQEEVDFELEFEE